MGLDAVIGSLVPGKYADLCAVSLSGLEVSPCYDPVSHLVYAAGREHVTHVWVNGELLVSQGRLTQQDVSEFDKRILLWQNNLAKETKA
jgi:5-methylthioadenosine/S-adenosylhomocysteine deaminase